MWRYTGATLSDAMRMIVRASLLRAPSCVLPRRRRNEWTCIWKQRRRCFKTWPIVLPPRQRDARREWIARNRAVFSPANVETWRNASGHRVSHTRLVTVDITATAGGGLLGDLLCNLAQVFNQNPANAIVQRLLTQIAALLGGLLG